MNLRQAIKLSFITLLALALGSCGDSDEYVTTLPSADAQIYALKIACKPANAIDSINYPIMAKTKFAIDQFAQLIYNQDSLPFRTDLKKKFATTLTFNSEGIGKVSLLYANDSIADWTGSSDSIDFSTPLFPKFIVTAPDGTTKRTYTIDIRVHKENPDTLIWQNISQSAQMIQPSTISTQKTLLVENAIFYTFSVDNDNKLYLHKAAKNASYESRIPLTGLPVANKFNLQSIIHFNNAFFATDTDSKVYTSTDGVTWQEKFREIKCVLGIVPSEKESDDHLLVITQDNYLSKITKSNTLEEIRPLNIVERDKLPLSGFTTLTNYNRTNIDLNLLIVTGGADANGKASNQTWLIQIANDKSLRIMQSDEHKIFASILDTPTFLYNNYMYALVSNTLYRSASFGIKWTTAPTDLEFIDPKMPKASGQSVVVDNDNYIWIFGGIQDNNTPVREIWKGRLNKLKPKK